MDAGTAPDAIFQTAARARAASAQRDTTVVPDTFQADREVVVEGTLDESGVFRADTLLTKCASKYESDGGQAPHADPRDAESTE